MQALTLTEVGGLERLVLQEVPAPALDTPHAVRVRIRCAALNRVDLFVTGGLPDLPITFPHVVGSDGAGVVESVGAEVTGVRPGDRVMLNPGVSCGRCAECQEDQEPLCSDFAILGEHRSGTAAELVVVPAANVAPVPAEMSWAQAAAFALATLTAWRMLSGRAGLRAGETVLVWGVGGGVGMAALQIGVLLGALTGHFEEAAEVHGAFDALCERYGVRPPQALALFVGGRDPFELTRQNLDADTWAAAYARGRPLTLDEAVALVVELGDEASAP